MFAHDKIAELFLWQAGCRNDQFQTAEENKNNGQTHDSKESTCDRFHCLVLLHFHLLRSWIVKTIAVVYLLQHLPLLVCPNYMLSFISFGGAYIRARWYEQRFFAFIILPLLMPIASIYNSTKRAVRDCHDENLIERVNEKGIIESRKWSWNSLRRTDVQSQRRRC